MSQPQLGDGTHAEKIICVPKIFMLNLSPMSIQAIKCPGYYEKGDGRIIEMKCEERDFSPAIIQEVGDEIRVRCGSCIGGICVSVVGKINDSALKETVEDEDAKQIQCVFLKET